MKLIKLNFLIFVLCFDLPVVLAHSILMPRDMPNWYNSECASCHMAFPPGLLGKKSWQNIMANLSNHYGADASVDSKNRDELTAWLIKNAATQRQFSENGPQNRITTTAWFKHEHVKIKPEVWKRSSIKSPSNCAACHLDAEIGIFHDTNVKIPH